MTGQGQLFEQSECPHTKTRVILEHPGLTHYAREECVVCNRFLRWLPKPETVERQKANAFRLTKLATCPDLTDWETQFIRSVGAAKKFSPKQQKHLDEIFERHMDKPV